MASSPFIVVSDDFQLIEEIGKGISSCTFKVYQSDTNYYYSLKQLIDIKESIDEKQLLSYFNSVSRLQYPFYLAPSYISLKSNQDPPSIFTQYFPNQSIQSIIDQQKQGKKIEGYHLTEKYLILYGVSHFLDLFHSDGNAHGSIKLTNILLDLNFIPFVTDPFLYKIVNRSNPLKLPNKSIDYVVSIPPETLHNNSITKCSDIYSFGILILQVLTDEINVFANQDAHEVSEIEKLILNKAKPIIPKIIQDMNDDLTQIINRCFSDQDRPSAKEIKKVFEKILSDETYEKRFNEFKNLALTKEENSDPKLKELKIKAQEGNLIDAFNYGRILFLGENCTKNEKEGMDYIRYAAKNSNNAAKNFYNQFRKDSKSTDFVNESTEKEVKVEIYHLKDDIFFDQKESDIKDVINDVLNHSFEQDNIKIDLEKINQNNYVKTPEALERLTKLKKYILNSVPILLEGPTGTAKTLSAEIICRNIGREIIRFNLSSQTKTTDLLGKFVGDSKSWAGIKMIPGPFIDAFENGKALILDEINLANHECLQFIEDVLDSDVISVEIQGMPLRKIKKNEKFCLIATQNPNKGSFAHKRQDLGNKFISRFQVINFPNFEPKELIEIAQGLAKQIEYDAMQKDQIIKDLVDFHIKWSNSKDAAEDIQCFTIREIAATIKALKYEDTDEIYNIIMTIYGARYQKETKEKIEKLFKSYPSFKNLEPSPFSYGNFPKCFHNKSLANALQSIFFSFKYHRHVILAGSEGSGLTQIATCVANYYNNRKRRTSKNILKYFCICTKETQCSDLIGRYKPSQHLSTKDNNIELIEWVDGFLVKAIRGGFCAVLDNFDEAEAIVMERLNPLLDLAIDDNDKAENIFEIQENPKDPNVTVNKNFHLLCTCKIDNLTKMSPALINRFDVIVLENQIQNNDIKPLIQLLMEQAYEQIVKDKSNEKSNLTNLIYQRIDPNTITMLQLSQLCKAVVKYRDYFKNEIDDKSIVDFSFDMLDKRKDFRIPKKIKHFLISNLKDQYENDDNKFFFKNKPKLEEFIAKLYAASLINIPVCVHGPTGAGKTSSAREFARIRPLNNKYKESFLMQTFHAETKPKDLYGTTTIKNEKIDFINGTLTIAMKNGLTFIADEMNLSSSLTMKSLAPALEPINGQSIYIPGVDEPVEIDPDFFFIACQNDIGTIGRSQIPQSIASRFRYFEYPNQEDKDISPICLDIAKSLYNQIDQHFAINASAVGKYMFELNKLKNNIIPQWSLRDINKLFLRIHYQDEKPENFVGMDIYKNLLFYTLSPVNNDYIDEVLDTVIDLIISSLPVADSDILRTELKRCFISRPKIEIRNGKKFLMKENCGVLFESFDKIDENLSSLLNGAFQILLSHPSEPILLMGPSSFKTFISKQFLKNAKTISLNQESTIAQLLGSTAFLSKIEAKLFYIEYICKICGIYNKISEYIDMIKNEKTTTDMIKDEKLTTDMIKNKKLTIDIIKNDIDPIIQTLPNSFKYAVNHLMDKLFQDDDTETEEQCVLSNLFLEFRPGMILSAILERRPLILKNLPNIQTVILERFNEFFSGKHNLTLNEDIYNTFTDDDNKELTDIILHFRLFATCQPNSFSKLPETVLSRFSVIWIHPYEGIETQIALNNYIKFKELSFTNQLFSILQKFSENMKNYLNKDFTFQQIINSVEMCSRLNKNTDVSNWENNIGMLLYRLGYGLLEKRTKTKNDFLKVFDGIKLPEKITKKLNSNPLKVIEIDGNQGVKSEITGFFFKSPGAKIPNSKIAFTSKFSEMLDVLHLAISINYPIILEGMPGQGKQTAINYIAQVLGYNVINIIISQSTKIDDLLGKIAIIRDDQNNVQVKVIKTKLVKLLESNSESNKSIIVFHNINNASAAVLEILASLFDQHQKDLLLPNGSTIQKRPINIVGIFNNQNGIFNRDRLPSSLIYSSIYHIVNNPEKSDISLIINKLFEEDNKFETKLFLDRFTKTKEFAEEANAFPLTLNDIVKYKTLRKETFGKFDDDIISITILAYRFLQQENITKVREIIGIIDMKFNPEIEYKPEEDRIFIKASKESKTGLSLNYSKSVKIDEIIPKLASLTLPQKHCLIFLSSCVLSHQSCIIQGGTASGKSHIIRLFADMLGKTLNVYQMNSETGVSILTGQSELSENLSQKDIKDLQSALTVLQNFDKLNEYIEKNIQNKDTKKWKRETFTDLIEEIEIIIGIIELTPDNENEIKKAKQKIVETIHPAKRFQTRESSFIRAMTKGEWVLIDGIEYAPAELAEKISFLCGENPELFLFESGENYYYTRKQLPNSIKISDDFHLFITYNPISDISNRAIDPVFMNKCTVFTLPSIDSVPEFSAQMILAPLMENYSDKLSVDVSSRMAIDHQFCKKESELDKDSFAGDITLTGRTVKFVGNEFLCYNKNENDTSKNIYHPICHSMKYYYLNSYINKEKEEQFKKCMLQEFKKDIDPKQFLNLNYNGNNKKSKYKNALINLRNIQLYACGNKNSSEFNFNTFSQNCQIVQINDIDFILNNIKDTIDIINETDKDKNYLKTKYDFEFYQLKIIERIFEDIIEGKKFLKDENSQMILSDKDLYKIKELEQPLSKFQLLNKLILIDSKSFSLTIPRYLFNSDFIELMNSVINLSKDSNLDNFKKLISLLHLNIDFIPLIESIFPYNLFTQSKKSSFNIFCYLMPLLKSLHSSSTTFHITVLEETFDFYYYQPSKFEPTYAFDYCDTSITFSPSTKIHFNSETERDISFDQKPFNNKTIVYYFYNLTQQLLSSNNSNNTKLMMKETPCPVDITKSHLSLKLSKDKSISIISKMWPIIYSLPDCSVKILQEYLLPLEKETLKLLLQIYEIINQQNVDQIENFSQWMLSFGNENSYVYKIKENMLDLNSITKTDKAKNMNKEIDEEIKYLNESPYEFIKEIWSPKTYIDLLLETKDKIKQKIDELEQRHEDLKLKKQLGIIFEQLDQIMIKDKKDELLRDQIKKEIRKDSEQSLTEEKINFYRNQVNKYRESVSKDEYGFGRSNIDWPKFSTSNRNKDYSSPIIKLFENIIWYSRINSIIKKILNPNNINVFQDINQLNKFPEMVNIVKLLTTRLFHIKYGSKDEKFQSEDVSMMKSILNAHFIDKLIKDNISDKINDLDSIFNKFEDRDSIINEEILDWIYINANIYPPNLDLSLPKFLPKDLIYLFIGFNENDENPESGPLLSCYNFNNKKQLLSDLKKGCTNTFDNAIQCSTFIGNYIYKYCVSTDSRSELKDSNSLKDLLNQSNVNNYPQSFIINDTLTIMNIAEQIDSSKKYKFIFNDTKFLKKNWTNDINFLNKYPSLVFWIYKNNQCAIQLQKSFQNALFVEDKIPFWLFSLRLMSSLSCIEFDCPSSTNASENIHMILNSAIRKQIRNRKNNIGTKWLNTILHTIPPEISITNYRMVYQFFVNILEDTKKLNKEISELKFNALEEFINNIFDMIFNDKLDSIFNYPINSKDSLIQLIKDPNQFICTKVHSTIINISEDFLNTQIFKNLKSYSNKFNIRINNNIQKLQNLISEECIKKEKQFIEEKNKRINEEIKQIKANHLKNIKKYQEYLDYLSNPESFYDFDRFQMCCNQIIEMQKFLPNCFDNKAKPLIIKLLQYKYKWYDSYVYIQIQMKPDKSKIDHNVSIDKKMEHNDEKEEQDEEKIEYKKICIYKFEKYYLDLRHFEEIKTDMLKKSQTVYTYFNLYPISEIFINTIDQYCANSIKETDKIQMPKLYFGDKLHPTLFTDKILITTKDTYNFVKELEHELHIIYFKDNTFEMPCKLCEKINALLNEFNAYFSDGIQCDSIIKFLNEFIKPDFEQLANNIYQINYDMKYKIRVFWNASYNLHSVFDNQYALPIPKYSYGNCPKNLFQKIKNKDFLSIPILWNENGSIKCCFDSLTCTIDPKIPSLYSKKIIMNFISFIKEPFSIEIETDKKYKPLFTSEKIFKEGDLVQIFISLPNISSNEKELHEIETKIHFKSNKLKEKILNCNFSMTILPLSFLIKCDKYPLSFKNNAFILCANNLISSTKLVFTIQNYHVNEKSNFKFQIESLKGNEIDKPSLVSKDNQIEILTPKIDIAKRFHGELKLKFSNEFFTSIIIDTKVIPFEFLFEVYDPTKKEFASNATIYYSKDHEFSLHCRIYGTFFIGKLQGKIESLLPPSIKIIKLQNIAEEFTINSNKEFDIVLSIKSSIRPIPRYTYKNKYYLQYEEYPIYLYINGFSSKINLTFIENSSRIFEDSNKINIEHIKKFVVYGYNDSQNKWEKILLDSNPSEYSTFVSPFDHFTPTQATVHYTFFCDIKNVKENVNKFMFINEKGETKIEKMDEISIKAISIFSPVYGIFENNWYPAYLVYSLKIDWKELTLDINSMNALTEEEINERITIAETDINNFKKSIPKKYNRNNFIYLFKLLLNGNAIINIKNIIEFLPKNIKDSFEPIINGVKKVDPENKLMIILKHDAILLFYKHFKNRYQEICNNHNSIITSKILTKNEIDFKIQECINEYYQVDQIAKIYPFINKFKKIEKSFNKIEIMPKPGKEEQNESYLYSEKMIPIPKSRNDKPQYYSTNHIESKNEISKPSIKLPKIELPQINIPEDTDKLSITQLTDIYLSCINGARLFPIHVSILKANSSPDIEKGAISYFEKLLQLYKAIPKKDYSFISSTTNLFNEAFVSMVGKLQKANVDFKNLLPSKFIISNESIQDFIQYPEKDKFIISCGKWNQDKYSGYRFKGFALAILICIKFTRKEEKNNEEEDNDIEEEDIVKIEEDEYEKEEEEEEENEYEEEEEESKEGQQEILQNAMPPLDEDQYIEQALSRMMNMEKSNALDLYISTHDIIDTSYPDIEQENYPVDKLIQLGIYFAYKLNIASQEIEIPRTKFAVNILIDCSQFISDENKIFNMMVICALTQSFESLEIPYSVAVIGDKNFTRIIKPFEEEHSSKSLQKILDLLMIKRLKTKLASSVKFAIDKMVCKERPYRAIFVFSDGLDEQLVLTKKWSEEILTDNNITYGFIFNKSKKLTEQKSELVEKKWNEFEKEINHDKERKILKILKILPIKQDFDPNNDKSIINDISDKLVDLFKITMNRSIKPVEKITLHDFESPNFNINDKLKNLSKFSSFLKKDYHQNKEVFIDSTGILKNSKFSINKMNPFSFRNKLKRITKCELDDSLIKDVNQYHQFIKDFIIDKRVVDHESLETIFKLNKASQFILSTTGTYIDITALVLNLIKPVPDPKIYLEEKGGLIRSYGVSIVIDPSVSCFDNLSGPHSFQTIRTILSSLASLELSCFDLIVAGNPHPTVICSEIGTIDTISAKTDLLKSLFTILQNPIHNTDLSSAIHTAFDLQRMRSTEYTSLLFVLTNGLYENDERDRIIDSVNICVQSGMNTIGIGIGIYPKGIEKIFPYVIFSHNPSNVMKAVASLYGDSISNMIDEMKPIKYLPPSITEFNSTIKMVVEESKNPIFKELKQTLSSATYTLDAFDFMHNMEKKVLDSNGSTIKKGTEMYEPNYLKTQKILIVMLWDNTLSKAEEKYVSPGYIKIQKDRKLCIEQAVKHFGITIEIVQNYEKAILELTKQTKKGYCMYYATWVFCGPQLAVLPDKDSDPNLVNQFNEVLIQFWKNGGSIVFWAEGEPLYYQVNLFLETVIFENEKDCPGGKTYLRLEGEHKGGKILYGDASDELKNKQTFNRSPRILDRCEREKLSHNINKIFEGITISYAPYNLELIKPFKPFARDSDGGISSLFYTANTKTGTGDIVIDCGFSKCFADIETEGTFRYIQNIAGWTARPEIHIIYDKIDPYKWRPNSVNYEIKYGDKWDGFLIEEITSEDLKNMKTLWAIDASDSVEGNDFYHNELKKIVDTDEVYKYKNGDEIYLWDNDKLKINKNELNSFISNRRGNKGTESSLIAEIAKESTIRDHLVIVTDGSVNNKAVDRSDELMNDPDHKIRFKFVTTFIILNENDPDFAGSNEVKIIPDLSVGAPYSRGCQNVTYYIKGAGQEREEMASLSTKDINTLANMKNIANFETFIRNYNNLKNAIQAQTLGKEGKDTKKLADQLDELYERIIKLGVDPKNIVEFEFKFNVLKRMASGALRGKYKLDEIAVVNQNDT